MALLIFASMLLLRATAQPWLDSNKTVNERVALLLAVCVFSHLLSALK
jgi:hypothetical protein